MSGFNPAATVELISQSESQLQQLCDQVPLGVFLSDAENRCVYANATACEIVGVTPEEARGHGWARNLHPEDRDLAFDQWKRAFQSETSYTAICRFVRPAGTIWARCHAEPWRNEEGQLVGYVGTVQDITEHRVAEETLREHERWFRTIFEQAGVGAALIETKTGRFVRINQRYCDLVGYEPVEMTNTTFQAITHPDDLQADLDNMRRLVAGEICQFNMEKRYYRKDGSIVWVNLTVSPTWSPGEEPQYHIAVVKDISQRKQAEQDLRESEALFRILSESAPVGILMYDADGVCRYANPRACEMAGLAPEQLTGSQWSKPIHPDDVARIEEEFQQAGQASGELRTECRFRQPDGGTIWTQVHVVPRYDAGGEFVGWVSNVLDITEQRQAIEALQDSEMQYRALFNANTDALFFCSLDGKVVDVNPATCRMHGYTREEFLKLDPRQFVHPDSFSLFEQFVAKAQRGELFHCEAKDLRKDGSAFDIEVYGTQMTFRGEPHAFAIVRDITERKQAEEKMRQQHSMLAHVSRLSTMGEMVAGIAHEVNQPLYSILNFAKATRNTLAGEDNPNLDQVRGWIDEIADAATRAGQIVERLRDFARRGEPQRDAANANVIVKDSVDLVLFDARRQNVRVNLDLAPQALPVCVDRVQIQQMLVNLLKNAIDALHETPRDERFIFVSTQLVEGEIEVRIADTGAGLPPEGDVFEPFVTTKPDGMGLGLAISRTIVEAHEGTIDAENNSHGGATFTLTLPLHQEVSLHG